MSLQSLLGSEALRRVLVHFAARPQSRLHFRALERQLGLSRQSLKNALDTLGEMGLVAPSREGRFVVYMAEDTPKWDTLRALIRDFASPSEVVGDLLRGIPGVRAVCVFGSAAARRMRDDSDVDVLVVGEQADIGVLGLASLEAGRVLGREIDLKYYAPETFRAERERSGTSYLKRALAGPTEWSIGGPETLAA